MRRLSTQLVAISSSAPKKIFVAVVALMSLRNAPLCWPSAIACANQLEVVLQERLGEALHELHRLAQLDLEDHGEILVAAEAFEMQVRDLPQPLGRIVDAGDRGRPSARTSFIERSKIETSRSSLLLK